MLTKRPLLRQHVSKCRVLSSWRTFRQDIVTHVKTIVVVVVAVVVTGEATLFLVAKARANVDKKKSCFGNNQSTLAHLPSELKDQKASEVSAIRVSIKPTLALFLTHLVCVHKISSFHSFVDGHTKEALVAHNLSCRSANKASSVN